MRPTARAVAALALGALAGPAAALAEQPETLQERLGHPASARLLVLHADDLGMAHSVNRATFAALEQGWITSASILVPCPWFPEVARWAREHPEADLGIHLALNSEWTTFRWGPVAASSAVPSLLDTDGFFPLVEPTVVQQARPPEVELELRAQIDRARAAGIRITHLDSHMGTLFRTPELRGVFRKVAADHGLPMLLERQGDGSGLSGQPEPSALVDRVVALEPGVPIADWPAAYEGLLRPLPPGVYELILHLAHDGEEMRAATSGHTDWGAAWRQADLDLVKSRRFRDFVEAQGFVLVTWKDLAKAAPPPAATAGAIPAGKPK